MNSPLLLEQYAAWRQADYQREAANERRALQARPPSPSLRVRLSAWLVGLALARLGRAAGRPRQGVSRLPSVSKRRRILALGLSSSPGYVVAGAPRPLRRKYTSVQ